MNSSYINELRNKYIEYRNILNISKQITFGVEIEYENVKKDLITQALNKINLDGWINKTEIDIREYNKKGQEMNGEVTSPILIDNICTWNSIKEVLLMLKSNNAIITNMCGGHVNIGIHIFENNLEYYKNFFYCWMLYSNFIRRFSTGEYDKLRKNKSIHFDSINFDPSTNNTDSVYGFHNTLFDKHHEIYIHVQNGISQVYDDRIEFRLPNGSLDPAIWQNNINFFTKFIIACKNVDREQILYNIKNDKRSVDDLINFTFNSEVDKKNFLIQYYKVNNYYSKKLTNHIFKY